MKVNFYFQEVMKIPYRLFTKYRVGRKVYCARNIRTGKSFCSSSPAKRKKAMRLREAFRRGWNPTGRARRK